MSIPIVFFNDPNIENYRRSMDDFTVSKPRRIKSTKYSIFGFVVDNKDPSEFKTEYFWKQTKNSFYDDKT